MTTPQGNKKETVRIFAAGSLRGVLAKLAETAFAKLDFDISIQLGPSGFLKERIENGDHADLFISANIAHPKELQQHGFAEKIIPLIKNETCLFGYLRPGDSLEDIIENLLDPSIRLGTSTPGDDPGGDYAFEVFKQVDGIRPGAYSLLSAKALQLVGGRNSAPVPDNKHPVLHLFEQQKIDAFLGYYTTALAIKAVLPKLQIKRLPRQIVRQADYTMTKTIRANDQTLRVMDILLSANTTSLFEEYGFKSIKDGKDA